jgi:hypothetical protein
LISCAFKEREREREKERKKENESASDFISFVLKTRVHKLFETFSETLYGRGAIFFFGLI